MLDFLKSIFKTKNYFGKTWKRPLVFASSELLGFNDLISKYPNFIRIVPEEIIPVEVNYFFYIGNGEFIEKCKVDLIKRHKSNLPQVSDELAQRVFDFANGYGDDSQTYTESHVLTIIFNERNKGLPGSISSKD
jgi:hypothetical protein